LFCIFGVEATGDPIFRQFKDEFEDYNDIEFENFWSIYFISLVYKEMFNCDAIKKKLKGKDIEFIDNMLKTMGISVVKDGFSLKDLTCSILNNFKNIKRIRMGLDTEVNATQAVTFSPNIEFDFGNLKDFDKKPIYLADFRQNIVEILNKYEFKIWVMLDRLDEVFPHRSSIEKNGLRGLLKAAYNFSDPTMRVKIFLRDDIIAYLAVDGFTALTHVIDRCSSTMSWSRDNIQYLIVKRIMANPTIRAYYGGDVKKVDKDKKYREEIMKKVFPPKIGRIPTIDWLYDNCADGNNIVTPRDIIDFFKFAKNLQIEKLKINPQAQEYLISDDIFKKSIEELSKHKKTVFLDAEFPHLMKDISAFMGLHAEYDASTLNVILGQDWKRKTEELSSIGFLKAIPKTKTYKIPIIWRYGLDIRRGREKLSNDIEKHNISIQEQYDNSVVDRVPNEPSE
jgi:hypothetical protein